MSTHLTLLQHQFDVAQKLIRDQMETIQLLKVQQRELQEEVDAWRAHAKAYENWFTTFLGKPRAHLREDHIRYKEAVSAREPYYRAAIAKDQTTEDQTKKTTKQPKE
jgi:hypothetical protein